MGMPRKIISLNDSTWRVAAVAQKPFGDVNDLAAARDWLPATVPGDVRLDLMRAGIIGDPFVGANNADAQWVDARDWWFVRDLALDLAQAERAFLVFDGIDYQSAIFWNGEPLARHVGMFSQQIVALPTSSAQRATSQLAVRVWGADALPKLRTTPLQKLYARLIAPLYRPPEHPFPDRYATLKCQMQFGWDFAPRLRTCGIWDEARVVIARGVLIQNAWIKPKVEAHKSNMARVEIELMLDSDRAQRVRVVCEVRGKNFECAAQSFAFDLQLARGAQTRTVTFDLADVRRWQPWDRGAPNVYVAEICVESETGDVCDAVSETFGIREFHLARVAGAPANAESWQFVINGEREFLRGANWVPLDAIPARLTRADYAARLAQARAANINFLRVWGGGLREKRAFYDLCDELGILVWQEFPFAGAILDRFPTDRVFLDLVRAECGAIVRALRNHPALGVWCGGNEFSARGNARIVETLRAVVAEHDGARPFKPASPYRDESHNWRVWHRFANLRDYRNDATPFLSEFGLQALPNLESLKKFLPADAWRAPHASWAEHHAQLPKLARYAQPISAGREPAARIEEFIAATQRAQAFGLQIAIEHVRRRKPQTAGVAVWQLNDCWPAISWSVVDYYGNPKMGYNELKRLYAPVFASFAYALATRRGGDVVRGDLWVMNDLGVACANAELRAELNGAEIFARALDIAPDSATRVDALAVTLGAGENCLRLTITHARQILSDHTYDLNFCDVGEISWRNLLMAIAGKWLLR